ncbi:MAG: DNA alkylation repair protein [Acidaminococcaceae bacterium]|nr:DNA alkylation repair protein [Acidaminococcaceae bacterium]MDD4721162.1 DNA alkylation repair protein [Acidaminococcaceae bacterium]
MDVRQQLFMLQDKTYGEFHKKLCPGIGNIIGVRLPALRKLAKTMANSDEWKNFLAAPTKYNEELLLKGIIIGLVKMPFAQRLNLIAEFIPSINNWGVCDTFCVSLIDTKKNQETMWEFLQGYLCSHEIYKRRFAIVMLLDYFIDDVYIERTLKILSDFATQDYYVQMAVAWAISICFVKYPEKTMHILHNNKLDDFTYNKALQKITESLRVDKKTKDTIRTMKRRGGEK